MWIEREEEREIRRETNAGRKRRPGKEKKSNDKKREVEEERIEEGMTQISVLVVG